MADVKPQHVLHMQLKQPAYAFEVGNKVAALNVLMQEVRLSIAYCCFVPGHAGVDDLDSIC